MTADGDHIPLKDKGGKLGRDACRSFVPQGKGTLISREHIRIDHENGEYYIEDLDSTNGTRVNGSNIGGKGKVRLSDGDIVILADVLTLTFKV